MSAIGFPDFRRQQDWDAISPIFSASNAAKVGAFNTGVLYVGNFAYLTGTFQVQTNPVLCEFRWFADAAGTQIVGTRSIGLSSGITDLPRFNIPNLGRYVQLRFDPGGALAWTLSMYVLGSNRPIPSEFVDQTGLIVSYVGNQGAGVSVAVGATAYAAGIVVFSFFSDGQASEALLETFHPSLTWVGIDVIHLTAGRQATSRLSVVPAGLVRVTVSNLDAALGTFACRVVNNLSGN